MNKKRLLVICNALDDKTRIERKISTDSPAATRKIFLMCRALIAIGVDVEIISLGRGSVKFGDKNYPSIKKNITGLPIYYLPFYGLPLLSQLITLIFATISVLSYRRYNGQTAVLFYNRMPAYAGALLVSRILAFNRVLDLEDGETKFGIVPSLTKLIYDKFCNQRALIASSSLIKYTSCQSALCFYGINKGSSSKKAWANKKINFLFSGTISIDTGAKLLLDTIGILREQSPPWTKAMEFIITGKGEFAEKISELQVVDKTPFVKVHGRLPNNEYSKVINETHVGLALKPIGGLYADTTFPSKVIEFASNNILVITSNISDVKKVLGSDGALFLDSNAPDELIQKLKWVVDNRAKARSISKLGKKNINYYTDPISTANTLSDFIFN
jgi:hypothetical protein